MPDPRPWRDWPTLSSEEQLALREAYGRFLDTQPPSCDLEVKRERFRAWLADRRIRYPDS
jgi:hypothetical protein